MSIATQRVARRSRSKKIQRILKYALNLWILRYAQYDKLVWQIHKRKKKSKEKKRNKREIKKEQRKEKRKERIERIERKNSKEKRKKKMKK